MKIITGYMPPTAGEVLVDSLDVVDQSLEIRRKIGYLPENTPLYTDINVVDYLVFVQRLREYRAANIPPGPGAWPNSAVSATCSKRTSANCRKGIASGSGWRRP